jgi:hypothetical protein
MLLLLKDFADGPSCGVLYGSYELRIALYGGAMWLVELLAVLTFDFRRPTPHVPRRQRLRRSNNSSSAD